MAGMYPPQDDDRRAEQGAPSGRGGGAPQPSSSDAPTQAAVPVPDPRSTNPVDDTRDWYSAGHAPYVAPQWAPAAPWAQQRPPRARGLRRIVVAASTVTVIAVSGLAVYAATGERNTIAGTAVTVSGPAAPPTSTSTRAPRPTPAPPPPVPMVATEDLEGLLIDDAALSELVGVPLTPGYTPPDATMSVDPTDNTQCRGALTIAAAPAYEESRWTAIRRQTSRNLDSKRSIAQAVVNYPSPQLAEAFVEAQSRIWQGCDGQIITFDPDTDPLPVRIHSVAVNGVDISAVATSEAKGSNCFRELRAVANVVIDTAACDPATVAATDGAAHADRVATLIAERIPDR